MRDLDFAVLEAAFACLSLAIECERAILSSGGVKVAVELEMLDTGAGSNAVAAVAADTGLVQESIDKGKHATHFVANQHFDS